MSRPHNDETPAREARFDAAWRAASKEEPPAALDAAILAAARREVGARPQRSDPALREATRPERWWFPLAAAATIGAVALGLLQLVGPDKLFGGDTSTVVSDIPPGTTTAPREAPAGPPAAPPAARGITIPPPPTGQPTVPHAAPGDLPATTRPEAKLIRRPLAETHAQAPGAQSVAPTGLGKMEAGGDLPMPSPAAPAQPSAAVQAPPGTSAAAGTAPTRLAPAAAAPAPAPAAALQKSIEGASAAAPAAASAGGQAASPVDRRRADAVRDADDARTPLPVAEWIALIRKLRDEGRIEEARKELLAFRNAHPDHELLLPPDLVRWQPAAR